MSNAAVETPVVDAPVSHEDAHREYRRSREAGPVVPAAAAAEETETESSSPSDDGKIAAASETVSQDPDAKKPLKGIDKRFKDLTDERAALKARNEALEKQLAGYTAKPAEQVKPAVDAAADDAPKAKDFDTYEDYVRSLTKWELKQDKLSDQRAAQAKSDAEADKTRAEKWEALAETARATYADYDEVIAGAASTMPISQAMHVAIVESDHGPDVGYYLAHHPEECAAIAKLSPSGAARAIGRLEVQFASKTPAPEAVTKPRASAAPGPIAPIAAKSASAVRDPEKMSPREYRAYRERGGS